MSTFPTPLPADTFAALRKRILDWHRPDTTEHHQIDTSQWRVLDLAEYVAEFGPLPEDKESETK